ncbi:MAG: thiol-disulfide oxidoreductase DCC family protein [Myxococcales bacterium]
MSFEGKRLVLFDGVCNVCNALILFIIDRDPREQFVFAPLSSELGRSVLAKHDLGPNLDSVVLVEDGRAFSHSTAILRILGRLGGVWRLFWAGFVLPRFARDWGYRYFARHRYAWFGKSDQCRVPTPELRRRFLASN